MVTVAERLDGVQKRAVEVPEGRRREKLQYEKGLEEAQRWRNESAAEVAQVRMDQTRSYLASLEELTGLVKDLGADYRREHGGVSGY
ncbi:MAG TPA: hypothetical protein VGN26_12030 [Armatimonadota bacterium]|jgi:hypothetical protein